MTPRRALAIGLAFFALAQPGAGSNARTEWVNRLKTLGLALQNHNETFGYLPHDLADELGKWFDKNQKPHLSWRVGLLPFAEEDYLYKKFKFVEPWDSWANKRLLDDSRNIYTPHWFSFAGQKRAGVVMPRGPSTFWGDGGRRSLKDWNGDPSRTILLIEVDEAHAPFWTEPRDLIIDPANPHKGIGWHWEQGLLTERACLALFADGHVGMISQAIEDERLRQLFAGEVSDSMSLNWLEAISQTSARWLVVPGMAISLAALLGCVLVLRRMRKTMATPGEWLLLMLGVKYVVLLVLFLAFYEHKLLYASFRNEAASLFLAVPRFFGSVVCYLAATRTGESRAWTRFFWVFSLVQFLSALGVAGVDHYGLPEGAFLAMPAVYITAGAGLAAILLSRANREIFAANRIGHWIGVLACFVPLIWFCISWPTGYSYPQWFMQVRD